MPIRVVADDLTGMRVVLVRGTKISEGGVCLFALANLAIGDRIDVEFTDSDFGTPIRVSGIIRNRAVYLYGVEFLIDQQEHRQQIARLSETYGTDSPSARQSNLANRLIFSSSSEYQARLFTF